MSDIPDPDRQSPEVFEIVDTKYTDLLPPTLGVSRRRTASDPRTQW